MRHFLAIVLTLASLVGGASAVLAQGVPGPALGPRASTATGRVDGIVTDQTGATLDGVSVLALGSALAMVRTDGAGRFSLQLPPGQYVLRATREGYVSTYREPVRIQSDVSLRRSITLVRADAAARDAAAALPADGDAIAPSAPVGEHAHSDTAWRLRHLTRTVLRDEAGTMTEAGIEGTPQSFFRGSALGPVDWLVVGSARAATAFLSHTDFSGQVNLLATTVHSASGQPGLEHWGRGVAYVDVGAPVGNRGDWLVRAAIAPGEAASWALQGEYQARAHRTHAFRTGMSYSVQPEMLHAPLNRSMAPAHTTRSVGGVYAYDHWTIGRALTLDYGFKIDRYDYLADPTLVSGRAGVRAALTPTVTVVAEISPRMAAPGADQFLPPRHAGVWLPPQRTFSALGAGTLRPEQVDHYEFGLDAAVAPSVQLTIRAFQESTDDQIATLFGLDEANQAGHYYFATAGSVDVRGLAIGVDARVADVVRGRIVYTRSEADWHDLRSRRRLSRVAPSLIRLGAEQGHDLSASIDGVVPQTATHVSLAYRFSSLFSEVGLGAPEPTGAGRFRIDIRQQLPFRPIGEGQLNILMSARTLLRDTMQDGSFYDDLMTVAPPVQVVGGIQLRF